MVHRHHESVVPGEIPVPHGPQGSDDGDDFPGLTNDERRIFSHVTRPDDCYTEDGVYWADLPVGKRIKFVSKVDNEEAKKEASSAWAMFKEDPLSNFSWYFRHAVIPGAGLGLEGYVLFSIGNLLPLFQAVWPECWNGKTDVCSSNWLATVTYLEIIGIMVGQVFVGVSFFSYSTISQMQQLFTKLLIRLLVIGSVDDGVSSRMLPSCSLVSSCSLPPGA